MITKKKEGQRIEKHFRQEKDKLLAMENKAQLLNKRINVYRKILNCTIKYFPLNQNDNFYAKNSKYFKKCEWFYFKIIMGVNFTYDGKFNGNILIVGLAACSKNCICSKPH